MFLISRSSDAILARERARETAKGLGFGLVDQTKIAFTVSELAMKLIALSEQCSIIIDSVFRDEGKAGIEVRMYEEHEGPCRLEMLWAKPLVDDLDVKSEPSQETMITFRKWRKPPVSVESYFQFPFNKTREDY